MKNFEKKRGGSQLNFLDEIIVDNFAGGGGASTGMELATGRPVAIAINHDPDAILMHRTNHPYTEHLQASVWDVDPREVCRGRPVGLAWFSPDCKHFSKAKGAALVDRNIRGLAWIVLRWAGTVRPRVIILENVEEFVTWGPVRKGKPVKKKAGQTFQKWKRQLLELGYQVEHREIVAADLGAPTTRKRFVLVARCDGRPIVWPERTHGPRDSEEVRDGRLMPWKSAAEIIDWSVPCYSVFASKRELKEKYGVNAVRPLADNTMRRVIRGVDKFTIRSGRPFIVECNHGGDGHARSTEEPVNTVTRKYTGGICAPALVPFTFSNTGGSVGESLRGPVGTVRTAGGQVLAAANIIQYHTEQTENVRANGLRMPLPTVTAVDHNAVAAAHIVEFKGQDIGQDADRPLRTITASAGEFADCRAELMEAGSQDLMHWPEVRDLLNRHCGYEMADDEILLLEIGGGLYFIADILLRMLTPRELYNAMGFPQDYIIDRDCLGNEYGKTKQVARCGNAVCPPMATALVRANLPEWCSRTITTMEELEKAVTA
jgi:DNA (cytosine-5)-methyltransferase 1